MYVKLKTTTDMKKIIITLTMLLVLGMTTEMIAQKHRHTPQQTELVDSTSKDAVEAFSDTTSTSQASAADDNWPLDEDDDTQIVKSADRLFDFMDSQMSGMLFVLAVLLIIFVLSPVFIIIAVFYFINKNRKDKMRLAQMAMQQGQPIPEQLLKDQPGNTDEEYKKGIRQCFVGVGLMIFLGYAAGTVGFGIGALVFCIGLGKVFVSKTAGKSNVNNNDVTQL
jgi:uncharacterized protein YxeA